MYFKIKFILIILALSTFFLTSCGIYKKTNVRDIPVNADERVQKNIEEGRGFKLGGNKNTGIGLFAEFNPLWRAALDTLDFMVLSSADYGGGIIITDWYSETNNNDESIKITVRFLSNEIRADGLDIIVHQKICTKNYECKTSQIDGKLNDEIKIAILKNAAVYEKKFKKKRVEDYRKKNPKRLVGDEKGDKD